MYFFVHLKQQFNSSVCYNLSYFQTRHSRFFTVSTNCSIFRVWCWSSLRSETALRIVCEFWSQLMFIFRFRSNWSFETLPLLFALSVSFLQRQSIFRLDSVRQVCAYMYSVPLLFLKTASFKRFTRICLYLNETLQFFNHLFWNRMAFFCAGQFPGEKGLVAPGMACKYTVRFSPDSLRDFEDEIVVNSQKLTPLVVKITSRRPRPILTSKLLSLIYNS